MSAPPFRIERLGEHDRTAFASGEPATDRWFQERARQMSGRGLAVVHVLVRVADAVVIGYYSLSNFTVLATELPPELGRKLPNRIPLPAHLIGQIGVDTRHQGQGYGLTLLYDALQRAERQTAESASFGVVVHALTPQVAAWYERIGFQPLTTNPLHLIISMTNIRVL